MKMIPPKHFREHIAKRISKLSRQHEMSVAHMCGIMGITRHTWDATINGRREVKAIELYRLACNFDCDIEYFYPWSE